MKLKSLKPTFGKAQVAILALSLLSLLLPWLTSTVTGADMLGIMALLNVAPLGLGIFIAGSVLVLWDVGVGMFAQIVGLIAFYPDFSRASYVLGWGYLLAWGIVIIGLVVVLDKFMTKNAVKE
jgi:hypothetical protein